MNAAKREAAEDKEEEGATWHNPIWLRGHLLTKDNLMEYFAQSRFYNTLCTNEQARVQRLSDSERRSSPPFSQPHRALPGIGYDVVYFAEKPTPLPRPDPNTQPPTGPKMCMAVVVKHVREGSKEVDVAYYCVVNGIVFQCPRLYTLMKAKMDDIACALDQLFDTIYDDFPAAYADVLQLKYKSGMSRSL